MTFFDAAVGRSSGSKSALERGHILLGRHADTIPILLPTDYLGEHLYLLGDSGSGKTSGYFAPIGTQVIRAGGSAVVFLDPKGDPALFEAVRIEAKRAGRTFRNTSRTSSGGRPMSSIDTSN